jgi:hypothetical protein
MRGFPDRKCDDCGEINGGHRTDCAGKEPCSECGGRYRYHATGCSRFFDYANEKTFKPGDHVTVSDVRSHFCRWIGSVVGSLADNGHQGLADFYECRMSPRSLFPGHGSEHLTLTFHASQLKGAE